MTCQPSFAAATQLLFILLLSLPFYSTSYRIGEAVDTILRTPEESTDALTSQMPLFGVPSTAIFTEDVDRFSLAFQEGLKSLAWIPVYNHKKRPLQELIVTFVYSRSGDGTIYSVSSEAVYSNDKSDNEGFRVKYKWVQEEEVDLQAGALVMFVGVCIVSVIVLIQACIGSGYDHSSHRDGNGATASSSYEAYGQQTSVSSGMPKWD